MGKHKPKYSLEQLQQMVRESEYNTDMFLKEAAKSGLPGVADKAKKQLHKRKPEQRTAQEIYEMLQEEIKAGRTKDVPRLIESLRRWREYAPAEAPSESKSKGYNNS